MYSALLPKRGVEANEKEVTRLQKLQHYLNLYDQYQKFPIDAPVASKTDVTSHISSVIQDLHDYHMDKSWNQKTDGACVLYVGLMTLAQLYKVNKETHEEWSHAVCELDKECIKQHLPTLTRTYGAHKKTGSLQDCERTLALLGNELLSELRVVLIHIHWPERVFVNWKTHLQSESDNKTRTKVSPFFHGEVKGYYDTLRDAEKVGDVYVDMLFMYCMVLLSVFQHSSDLFLHAVNMLCETKHTLTDIQKHICREKTFVQQFVNDEASRDKYNHLRAGILDMAQTWLNSGTLNAWRQTIAALLIAGGMLEQQSIEYGGRMAVDNRMAVFRNIDKELQLSTNVTNVKWEWFTANTQKMLTTPLDSKENKDVHCYRDFAVFHAFHLGVRVSTKIDFLAKYCITPGEWRFKSEHALRSHQSLVPRVQQRPTIVTYNGDVYVCCDTKLYSVPSLTDACVAWMYLIVHKYGEMLSNTIPFHLKLRATAAPVHAKDDEIDQ